MNLPLLPLLLVPVFGLLVLAAARIWVVHVRPNSIQGSDLHMLKWAMEQDTRCWLGFHVALSPDCDFDSEVAVVRQRIAAALSSPRSDFRRTVDRGSAAYRFEASITVDDLVVEVGSDAELLTLNDSADRPLLVRFHSDRRWIGVLFDHTVWDGIGVFNEVLCPALGCAPFDEGRLVEERYIPLLSESLQLYTLAVMGLRMLRHRAMTTLRSGRDQKVFVHTHRVAAIRRLRDETGAPFTIALLAHWAHSVQQARTSRKRPLRVGLVVGMKNPRFRNNYSMLVLDVPFASTPATIARQLRRQARWRSIEVQPTYQLISYLELQTLFKRNALDALFSPVVFERQDGPSRFVEGMSLYNIPCSTPLYAFSCSTGDTITISTTWNTPEVDPRYFSRDAVSTFQQTAPGVLNVQAPVTLPTLPEPD